MLKAFPNATT